MNYQEALDWIHSLYRFGANLGLERVTRLMELLGNPQQRFRSVHIAGTNGKGSTAAFLAAMLQAEGLKVGLYTSPYIEAFTNRLAINGVDIDKDHLVAIVKKVKAAVEEMRNSNVGQPTEFEVVTALAFTYFAMAKPDWVVVEVGMGGRLDATNVITPDVAVITNISLEHTQVLGSTVAAIAGEKAGIIKPKIPVVTAAADEEALAVIRQVAAVKGSPLYQVDKDFTYRLQSVSLEGTVFSYKSPWRELADVRASLLGRHQARNAALALAARELMPLPFRERAAREGLLRTRWPGRLELSSRRPLVLVDGAHNPDGVLVLRTALQELLGGRRLHLVIGILADKAVDEILGVLVPLATAGVIITAPQNPRAADPNLVAELAGRYAGEVPVEVIPDVDLAVKTAVSRTRPEEALCVCGSLYTVSEARETLKILYPQANHGCDDGSD